MDNRKSLIDVGVKQIENEGEIYKIDVDFGVKRGGSSLVYKVTSSSGRHLILKETYPYRLADIYRISEKDKAEERYKGDVGDLVIKKGPLSDCDSEKLFEEYKELAREESENLKKYGQIYDGQICNKDDYIWNCAGFFDAHNTRYVLIECTVAKTLDEVFADFEYPIEKEKLMELLTLVAMLLKSVANLHDKHLLHLDIAPANVMLSNAGLVRLIDFNSVYEEGKSTEKHPFSYREGFSALELRLVAKDKGANAKLSYSTDIYSVGALLFYALFKRTPETIDKACPQIWENQLGKLLKLSPVLADVPKDISEVLKKALNNKPSERYQHASEMLEAIDKIIDKIKNEGTLFQLWKEKLNTTKVKRTACIAMASIFMILTGFQITKPNCMLLNAEKFLGQNDTAAALDIAEEVYYNRKPWHFFYPEQKINNLAREMYYNGIAFSIDFDKRVLKSVRKDNAVIAALEDDIIEVKDITHETTLHKYDINTQSGEFSRDCNYWASLDNGQLRVYELQYGKNGIVYSENDVINFSFSEDSELLLVIYSDNSWRLVDFIADRAISNGKLAHPCSYYENFYKLCDLNRGKEAFCYVTDTRNVVIVSSVTGIELGQIDVGEALGIQFSQKLEAENVEVFIRNTGAVCFDYSHKTYSFGVYDHYNYFFDRATATPYEHKNNYALINDGKTVVSTSKRNPFSIMAPKIIETSSYKDSLVKALEQCDISYPYYYDYDYSNNILYRTNLNNIQEVKIRFQNEDIIKEIIVNEKDIALFYDGRIVFGKITDSSIAVTKELNLSDNEVYRLSRNKRTFVLIDSERIDVYKYDKQWKYCGRIRLEKPLRCGEIDNDGQVLVAQEKGTADLYWFDLENLAVKDKKSIDYPVDKINADDSTAVIYGESGFVLTDLKKNKSILTTVYLEADEKLYMSESKIPTYLNKRVVFISDFSKKKGAVTSTMTETAKGGLAFTIKRNNTILTQNALCRAVAFSDNEICFLERINNKDCLVMYDLRNQQKTILNENLVTYNPPFLEPLNYELYSPREGYLNLSAQYIAPAAQNGNTCIATISSLYTHCTTEELLQLTREIISD